MRESRVGKFNGSQDSEARAAQDRDREVADQIGGRGHACLGEHDDVDVVGEAPDMPGDAVKEAVVVTGLESFPCVQARRFDEVDVAPGICGTFLEQLPSRRKRGLNSDHERDAAAVSDGALGHRSVDAHDRSLDLLREAFRRSAEVEQVHTIAPGSHTASSRRRARTRASIPASRPCLRASLSSSPSTRWTPFALGATSVRSPLNVATCTSAVCRKATVRTSGVNHV